METRARTVAIYVLLSFCALVPYSRVGSMGFTNFDDPGYVTQNPQVKSGLSPAALAWAFTSTEQRNWHPVTWISHMIDFQLYGMNASGHHATSLVLHLLCTLLLFGVLHTMTGAAVPSAAVAALFAVHPLHVESVAWIAERKDVLSTVFWFLSIWAYVGWVRNQSRRHFLLLVTFFGLGLASKPMLVTLPFVLLLLDYWPLNRFPQPMKARGKKAAKKNRTPALRARVTEKWLLFGLSAISCVITYTVQQSAVVSFQKMPLLVRLANAVTSYALYLRRAFWPSDLCAFYPQPENFAWFEVMVAAGILLSITAGVIAMRSVRPYLMVGWFWFLGTLVPVIGIIQVGDQALADRYTYIPLTGIFIMLAWAGSELAERYTGARTALAGAAAAIVIVFGWVTWNQTRYWETSDLLFARVLQITGRNPVGSLNLGEALASRGDHEAAISLVEDSLRKDPQNADIHAKLGTLLAMQGKDQPAIEHFEAALRINPKQPDAHNGLGALLATVNRLDEAIAHHQQALEEKPRFPQAHCNLGKEYAAKGMPTPAIEHLRKAIELKPDYTEAHEKLAGVLAGEKQLSDALPHFQAAIKARPDNADLRFKFAQTLAQMRNIDEATNQLREVVKLRPSWPEALNNLAWFLATRQSSTPGERAQSVVFAETAVKLAGKPDPGSLDTLAAAYAAAARFGEAAKKAEEAMQLANQSGQRALALDIESRARLYRTGKSYVER